MGAISYLAMSSTRSDRTRSRKTILGSDRTALAGADEKPRPANGRQLKCLVVTDELTNEGLAIDVGGRTRSARVVEVLSGPVGGRGVPRFLRSDNGPEFVCKTLSSWIAAHNIDTALTEPGTPWQNGVTESFNGKCRDECLGLEWFRSRTEAKVVMEAWRRPSTISRPTSS